MSKYTTEQLQHMCQEALADRGSMQYIMFITMISGMTGNTTESIERAMHNMIMNGEWE
jgi:hypothetical protein